MPTVKPNSSRPKKRSRRRLPLTGRGQTTSSAALAIGRLSLFILVFLAAAAAVGGQVGCGSDCHEECADEAASSSSTGGNISAEALAYCDCMLLSCHDAYHGHFGPESDEEAARNNCLAEAETLPVAGMAVQAGNFIECRMHHCELGKSDESACPASIGEGVCQ